MNHKYVQFLMCLVISYHFKQQLDFIAIKLFYFTFCTPCTLLIRESIEMTGSNRFLLTFSSNTSGKRYHLFVLLFNSSRNFSIARWAKKSEVRNYHFSINTPCILVKSLAPCIWGAIYILMH